MTISPIHRQPNPPPLAKAPPKRQPQGLAQMRDRLEGRPSHDDPPSLFKEFLFEPIFQVIKFAFRGIFTFIDFLRRWAFEEKSVEPAFNRALFLERLRAAPRQESILFQFEQLYSSDEKNQVYRAIGEAHAFKVSWKELIWNRTAQENIALGRRLVRQNPFLLRDYSLK